MAKPRDQNLVQVIRHFLLHEPTVDEFSGHVFVEIDPLVDTDERTEKLLEGSRRSRENVGGFSHRKQCTTAASADRLRAEETISTFAPMTSIKRPKASGATACAIRAGAPMMPRR